jgi:hypothetical protein
MVEPVFPNFRVNRDGSFNNLAVNGTQIPSSENTDKGRLLASNRNISIAQTIKLTFPEPEYIFFQTGLQDLFTGKIYSTIQDYTGGTVEGRLVLPFADTGTAASIILNQFKLTTTTPDSVIFIDRKISGGKTPINFGTFLSTFKHIKFSRVDGGVQSADNSEIQLWTTDDEDSGFYIFINGLKFSPGLEEVRLIASQNPPPLEVSTCCQYNPTSTFDKFDFIQTLHPEYSLNAWCYFGRLVGNSDTYSLTFVIQKTIPFNIPYVHHKLAFDVAGGINSATLSKWQIDGCVSSQGPTTKNNLWSVSDTCNDGAAPADLTTLSVQLISGNMGEKNATYKLRLEAIIAIDLHVNPVYIEVEFTDVLGTINEGFGPDAFLPNWLTSQQRSDILTSYSGSVENYLASGMNNLECQGSYYFSQPLLSVDSFTIFDLDGAILDTKAVGNDSVIWFDYVNQTFNNTGLTILNDVGWEFFAIQFPTEKQAIMVTKITTQTSGVYLLANLFTESSTTRWNLDDISIVGSNIWTSPTSKQYYMTYNITLTNPSVTITVQTEWENQEISVGGQTKYEGICAVTATVLGAPMIGFSWIEQQSIN